MHLAWLYLLQAEFIRDGIEIRYPHPKYKGRFDIVDGEHRTWELERCVKRRWPDVSDPIRANLEFFIKFRNKTEHRYKGKDAALLTAIADKSQALLLNFEEELTSQFGKDQTLAGMLRFPIFIGTFTEPAELALKRLRKSLNKDLQRFLTEYDSGLEPATLSDPRYSFRLKVMLEPAQRGEPDLAVKFVRADELTPEQSAELTDVGKTGAVIVKERSIPVANDGLFKFTHVIEQVQAAISFQFNQSHLLSAIKSENVRPKRGSKRPERTRAEFCTYDSLNANYGYTQTYINHLVEQCSSEEGFETLTGRKPERIVEAKEDIATNQSDVAT
jgi:hypothetical protein